MDGAEFTRMVRRYGRRTRVSVTVVARRGKGSHRTLYIGARHTVVKSGKIATGLYHAMCKQLGIDPRDL